MIILEVVNMLINEVAQKCNITKKAVQYYVDKELIVPNVLENGYKDFSEQDTKLLKKIVLYRKLGLSVSDIKETLNYPDKLTCILHQRTLELEREKAKQKLLRRIENGEKIENLELEINNIGSNTIILYKLLELFPGYYGKFISLNFSRYLTCEIETKEQMEAFYQIITFFDNVPDINLSEDLQQYLDEYSSAYSSEEELEMINHFLQEKHVAIQDMEKFVRNNKEHLDEYKKMQQTKEFKNSPAFRLMEYMKRFCANNGYYDIFIPAMRRLSSLYNEYYKQMIKANDKFIEIYPEYLE